MSPVSAVSKVVHNLASPGRRLAAGLIDLTVMAVPSALVWLGLDYAPHALNPAWRGSLGEFLASLIVPWFIIAWALGYLIWWTARQGGTVGKQLLGLAVARRVDGATPIGYPWATVRALGCVLSALPLGLGFLWALWDRDRQTWHDKLAETVVVCAEDEDE